MWRIVLSGDYGMELIVLLKTKTVNGVNVVTENLSFIRRKMNSEHKRLKTSSCHRCVHKRKCARSIKQIFQNIGIKSP